MNDAFSRTLKQMKAGRIVSHGPVHPSPLVGGKGPAEEEVALLSEASEGKTLCVEQPGEGGSVPELRAVDVGQFKRGQFRKEEQPVKFRNGSRVFHSPLANRAHASRHGRCKTHLHPRRSRLPQWRGRHLRENLGEQALPFVCLRHLLPKDRRMVYVRGG